VFKFDCGDMHVTAADKGLGRMRGNFEHLKKDQVTGAWKSGHGLVGDMGLILLRDTR
jgi:hypothetical protein